MKTNFFKWMGICGVAALLAGCHKNSQNTSSTANQNSGMASTADATATNLPPTGRSDNTTENIRDRNNTTVTPTDQSESASDREITRSIRSAITSNSQLSVNAKNIKVITINGKVTLRGPVNTEQERQLIESIVHQQAGAASVDDQLQPKQMEQSNQPK